MEVHSATDKRPSLTEADPPANTAMLHSNTAPTKHAVLAHTSLIRVRIPRKSKTNIYFIDLPSAGVR